ncbi:MAG: hypothetical protein KBS70_02660 [Bacteroidales bacterium]|nr:hypothetical protein [Candidatus Colicola equi]
MKAKPFVKWVGGKGQLIEQLEQIQNIVNVPTKMMPIQTRVTSYRVNPPLNTSITILSKEQLDGRFQ